MTVRSRPPIVFTHVAPNLYRYPTRRGLRFAIRLEWHGRQIRHKGFLSRTQAQDYLNTCRARQVDAKYFPERLPADTLRDYVPRWLATCRLRDLRHTTLRSYDRNLTVHILPVLGDRPLNQITRQDIVEFLKRKQAERSPPYRRDTLRLMLAPLSRLFSDAADEGVIEANYNPCLKPGRLLMKRRKKTLKAYPAADVRTILATTKRLRPDQLPLMDLLFGLGLRISEALALTPADVDLRRRRLTIWQAFTDGEWHDTPKSGQTRVLEIPSARIPLLRAARHTARHTGSRLLFPGRSGPIAVRSWRRWVWDRIITAAQVPRYTPHAARHTYATLQLERGCPLQWLMHQMGHSSIAVTVDTYGHLSHRKRSRSA